MALDPSEELKGGGGLFLHVLPVFLLSLGFLMLMAPGAPFTKELGVCESGAVRDVLAGHVILPSYTPGEMIQTPPLFWWAAALSVRVLGWTEVGLRAPSIVAGAVTCAILYAWIVVTLGRRAALWAVAALISSHYFADASRQPRMDEMLTMFLTGAMVCLERMLAVQKASGRIGFASAAALLMGLAVLAKGPLGVILPGLTIVLLLTVRRRLLTLFSVQLIATFAAAVAIGLILYWAAYRVGGSQFYQWQLVNGLWERFRGGSGVEGLCPHPFYYYLLLLVSGFLPWSLYLPALAATMWLRRSSLSGEVIFAACWFAAIFGFFSTSSGKCFVYILPAFPPLATLLGWLIAEQSGRDGKRGLSSWLFDFASAATGVGVVAIVAIAGGFLIFGVPGSLVRHLHVSDRNFLATFISLGKRGSIALVLWAVAWLGGGAMALRALARGDSRSASRGVAAIALTGAVFWFGTMNPSLAQERSLKSFAAEVDRIVPAGAQLDYVGRTDCDFAFYSTRPVGLVDQFKCDAGARPQQYFIFREDRLTELSAGQHACLSEVGKSASVDKQGRRFLMVESRR